MGLSVSGSGYSEFKDGGNSVYVHRLSAVAEHGFDAVVGNDVHHVHRFDGDPCKWVNDPESLVPEDPTTHRCRTLPNVPTAGD